MEAITIRVAPEAAQVFRAASAEERRKIEALINIWLLEATRSGESLKSIMHEISQKAQERGLTPSLLASILDEE